MMIIRPTFARTGLFKYDPMIDCRLLRWCDVTGVSFRGDHHYTVHNATANLPADFDRLCKQRLRLKQLRDVANIVYMMWPWR